MILGLLSLLLATPFAVTSKGSVEDKLWQRRVIVLLGEKNIPDVRKQAVILQKGEGKLKEREVDILAEQRPNGLLHKRFGHGEGFLVILLGKDGEEKLRSLKPVAMDRLTKLIDDMPMRQEEAEKKEAGKEEKASQTL
jgi:hypothetical protein